MKIISYLIYTVLLGGIACSYTAIVQYPALMYILIPVFALINLLAGFLFLRTKQIRLRVCQHGATLLVIFEISMLICIGYHIFLAIRTLPEDYTTLVHSISLCLIVEAIVFWNGILCIYCTSLQLGIGQRIVGALCGLIPVVNLVAMNVIIWTVIDEIHYEEDKERLNRQRREEQICKTKYPILMVHGVFFRDIKLFNYWGRIPKELERNGATVYYGNHQSANSVAGSGQELTDRIKEIVEQTGCEKVNIIAHSKGGLDCRYAIDKLGMGEYVASLTTVNAPHRGCIFADRLLRNIPEEYLQKVAQKYNTMMKKIGDHDPDFLAAVNDLTASACEERNQQLRPAPDHILCQSIGSLLKKARGGRFPMNLSYHLVKMYDGENDGMVSESSFAWGQRYILFVPSGKQGISHGDVTDINRRNLREFDVREVYVQLVNDLRQRGL